VVFWFKVLTSATIAPPASDLLLMFQPAFATLRPSSQGGDTAVDGERGPNCQNPTTSALREDKFLNDSSAAASVRPTIAPAAGRYIVVSLAHLQHTSNHLIKLMIFASI
jgi:hypothetical protein